MSRKRETYKLPREQTVKARPKRNGNWDASRNRVNGDTEHRPTLKMLNSGGIMCYNSWIREAGYESDARIPEWKALKEHQQERWRRIAKDVYAIMESNRISVEAPPSA